MQTDDQNKERKLGNIFGATGGNHAGMVFDQDYLSPALSTMQGGLRQPMIIVEDKECYCCASRGRDPENPNDRSANNPNYTQRLEVNIGGGE